MLKHDFSPFPPPTPTQVWQLLYKMDEWKDWNDVFDVAVGDGDGKEEVAVGKVPPDSNCCCLISSTNLLF